MPSLLKANVWRISILAKHEFFHSKFLFKTPFTSKHVISIQKPSMYEDTIISRLLYIVFALLLLHSYNNIDSKRAFNKQKPLPTCWSATPRARTLPGCGVDTSGRPSVLWREPSRVVKIVLKTTGIVNIVNIVNIHSLPFFLLKHSEHSEKNEHSEHSKQSLQVSFGGLEKVVNFIFP